MRPEQIVANFLSHVERTETCWLWTGATNEKGRGNFRAGDKVVASHRWAYENFIGQIPDGLQVYRSCEVAACVNPQHLELLTKAEVRIRQTDKGGRLFQQNARARGQS